MSWEDDYEDFDEADDSAETEVIACPQCGKDVYEDAPNCPYCGEYITNQSSLLAGKSVWFRWLWVIVVGFLVLQMLGFGF